VLLTTDAHLADAVLHAKSSGLKVTLFLAFCDYLFQVQVVGLQTTSSIHLTKNKWSPSGAEVAHRRSQFEYPSDKTVTGAGTTSPQEWDIAASCWVNGWCSRSQWRSSDGLLETQRSQL